MSRTNDNFFKKIGRALSRANDRHDGYTIRLNNKGLLLVKDENNKYKIWFVNSNRNWLWIYNNINHQNHGKHDTMAVDLFGLTMPVKLVKHGEGLKSYKTYTNENGVELETLFSYSNHSKRLFWTIDKFEALNAFDGDDKLTYQSLMNLQEMINDEYERRDDLSKIDMPDISQFDDVHVITEEAFKKKTEEATRENHASNEIMKDLKVDGENAQVELHNDDKTL